jgi:hypothetical protein
MRKLPLAAVLAACFAAMASANPWSFTAPPWLTWTEDPATTVTVTFESPEATGAFVTYAPAGSGDSKTLSAPEPSARHELTLRGLLPNTRYTYLAGDGTGARYEGKFRTAPADKATSFRFALASDLQGGLDYDAAVAVAQAVAACGADFAISTGDLSDYRYAPDYPFALETWREFFSSYAPVLASGVFQCVTGNHDEPENPDSLWFRLAPRPGNERDFAYTVGPVRFICLDNAEFEVPSRTPWLARELQKAAADPAVRWTLVMFHRPPHSLGERGGQGVVQEWWCPLFAKYEASLVIAGHSHTYQRTKPIKGVDYLVSGGGGGRLYGVDPARPEIAFATSCCHFVEFTCDPEKGVLSLAARDTEGNVFDRGEYPARRAVRFSPAFPKRGEECTISYDPAGRPLENAEKVFLHCGHDFFKSLDACVEMEKGEDGLFTATVTVPETPLWSLAFCFHDGSETTWDNNHAANWQILLAPDWR